MEINRSKFVWPSLCGYWSFDNVAGWALKEPTYEACSSKGKYCACGSTSSPYQIAQQKREDMVKALRTNVAGVDVHKEMIVVCILTGPADQDPIAVHFETSTMTDDLMAMGRVLLDRGIREVAMESTGVYWRPLYNVWTPMGIEVTVGNAHHMKNVPGRKTDYKDAQWIAHLHRMGFIKPSFIPEPVFQRLRQLSRHRTNMVGDLARVKNRVQKVLEDGNIKWSSIVSDTFGVAGVNILRAIAAGETSARELALLATTNIKRKEDKEKALKNYLTAEHCRVIKSLMNQYDFLTSEIRGIENELADQMVPYAASRKA